jgi:hypothetical protein
MDLSPEVEFDTWASFLVAMLEPGGEYTAHLADFERQLHGYCQNGTLPEPISNYTEQFATSLMPSIFTSIPSAVTSFD